MMYKFEYKHCFLALSAILTYTGEAQTRVHLIYKPSLLSMPSSSVLFSEVWIMAVREETTALKELININNSS